MERTNKLPSFFTEMLQTQYGKELSEKIQEGYSKTRNVTLRVNTLKSDIQQVKQELQKANIKFKEVNFYKDALIITSQREEEIQKLDIYKDGKIYLQSLSSMLPPIILQPKEKADILDMAAAPGGKTTQMAALSNNNSNITACEINAIRIEKLKYNIEKQGATSVYVMQKDARTIDSFFSFDQILLDAPCSGSGTLNINDENLEKIFTQRLIDKSMQAQEKLLKKAIEILKPGHEMVYSTCSILQCENEDILNKVLKQAKAQIVPIEFEEMQELPLLPVKIPGTICVCPTELFEGFFMAKIRKN